MLGPKRPLAKPLPRANPAGPHTPEPQMDPARSAYGTGQLRSCECQSHCRKLRPSTWCSWAGVPGKPGHLPSSLPLPAWHWYSLHSLCLETGMLQLGTSLQQRSQFQASRSSRRGQCNQVVAGRTRWQAAWPAFAPASNQAQVGFTQISLSARGLRVAA